MKSKNQNVKIFLGKSFLTLMVCGTLFSYATGKDANVKEKPLVAVMPFANKVDNPEYAGVEKGLADALAAELVKTKKFRLIERQRIETLLQEQKLQMTGLIDPATAAKIGTQLGAQAYVLGSIVSISMRDEWRSAKIAEKTTRKTEIEAEAKIVDIATGEMLAAGRAIGKSKTAEKHALGGKAGELATKESMIQKALQKLSKKLAKDLVKTYSQK